MALPTIAEFTNPPDRAEAGSDFVDALIAWIIQLNAVIASLNAYMAAVQAEVPASIGALATSSATATPTASKIPIADANGLLDGWISATSTPTASKIPVADSNGLLDNWVRQGGECYLSLVGSNLVLNRCNGYRVIIDNAVQTIPAAGVSLAPTGLTSLTLYYIYVCMISGVMTLEASTTSYTADPRNGSAVKSDDVTRALVGIAIPNSSVQWEDSLSNRAVASLFNPRLRILQHSLPSQFSTASTSPTPLDLGVSVVSFHPCTFFWSFSATNSAVASSTFTAFVYNAAGTLLSGLPITLGTVGNYLINSGSGVTSISLSEKLTPKISISSGTANVLAGSVFTATTWG